MSILNNLRSEIEISTQAGDALLDDANKLKHNLGLTQNEIEEAAHLLQELKRAQKRANSLSKHGKLLQELTRYA